MDKQAVIEFFNRCAPTWDAQQPNRDEVIHRILDNTRIGSGMRVLDVACGTGVLFPYYLERDVASVVGVDISPEMVRMARQKFGDQSKVQVIPGDVEEVLSEERFDAVMVYNAFPHFPDPVGLIRSLSARLLPGGRLTIAHGAGRAQIDAHHRGAARDVSNGLMSAEDLAELFKPYFEVDVLISDDRMYQVSGTLREAL